MKKTALFDQHTALKAKIVNFHGWQMPLNYRGIIEEHLNVRQQLGLFDVSHMGKILISGPQALSLLQNITTNDVEKLTTGKAQYSLFCNESGGIIDDLTIIKQAAEKFCLIVNAANIDKDLAHIKQQSANYDLKIDNISDNFALLALQGKKSVLLLENIFKQPINQLGYYMSFNIQSDFGSVCISRMGYTGEDGFEIMVENRHAALLWQTLIKAGDIYNILPVGLGARDSLRMEAGYLLHGQDIDEKTNPFSANLGWITKLKKLDFIGKQSIINKPPHKKLAGIICLEKAIPRNGYLIFDQDRVNIIGKITSGGFSPVLKKGIAMAYIDKDMLENTTELFIKIRDSFVAAKKVPLPFLKIEKPLLKK